MKSNKILCLWIVLQSVFGLCEPETSNAEALNPVIVTANRISEDAGRVSADVTVISRKQIEKSQARYVADLLRSQAGIHVASSGGPGKTTSVFLRGGNSGHVLVLIDGVRVGSVTTGSFDWSMLSTADIERIEIVRGPQSTLYGADAMSGVIQIFTRQGEDTPVVHVEAEAGSPYGAYRGAANTRGETPDGIRYALGVESNRIRGVSAASAGSEADAFRLTTVSGKLRWPLLRGDILLVARSAQGQTGLDNIGSDALNFVSNTRRDIISLKVSQPVSDFWDTNIQVSQSTDNLKNRDPNSSSNDADITTRIQQLTWANNFDVGPVSLLVGLDMHRDHGVNVGKNINERITQKAGFATISLHQQRYDLNAGIRHDRNSVSENKTTYRMGGVLRPVSGLKLTANYGTGFKAPSVNDLYWPTSAFAAGNPNLSPETSKSWDAGLSYAVNTDNLGVESSVTWFDQRFNNLIAWSSVGGVFMPGNISKATARGLEFHGKLNYGPTYLVTNWTWMLAKDKSDASWLPRRAKDSGMALLGVDAFGVQLEWQTDIVGPRFSSTGNKKHMAGYHKSDVRLAYTLNKHWTITGRIENLENKIYEEVSGFGVLGRAYYCGMRGNF